MPRIEQRITAQDTKDGLLKLDIALEGVSMKKRVRTCSKRCHSAAGKRCACVCQGFFHGKDGAGAANREALHQATEEEAKELLEQHGFKENETAYIEQRKLPLEVG